MPLKITLPGELSEKKGDEVTLGELVERCLGRSLLSGNRCWLSDWLRLRDGDLGLLNGWVVILRSTADHLWDWEDWCRDLEGAGVDIGLVSGAEERLGELRGIGQLVGGDSVGHWSLLDDRWRLVGVGSLEEGVASLGGLEEHSYLLGGVVELGAFFLLLFCLVGNAELLQDPVVGSGGCLGPDDLNAHKFEIHRR